MSYTSIKKREVFRFIFAGGTAVLTDFTSYHALMMFGIGMDVAKGSSFLLGSIVGFIINKLWTFESAHFSKGEIIRYCILYLCTAYINALVNRGVLGILNVKIVGFLCATGVSTVLNFIGQKYFVFKK